MSDEMKRLRNIFHGINSRCRNPNATGYEYYGGKGVRNLFPDSDAFVRWSLANGYSGGLQCDRIDGSGDYSPDNCRWVTREANMRNRGGRRTLLRLSSGEALMDACKRLGVGHATASARVRMLGYTPDEAVLPYADFLALSRLRRSPSA